MRGTRDAIIAGCLVDPHGVATRRATRRGEAAAPSSRQVATSSGRQVVRSSGRQVARSPGRRVVGSASRPIVESLHRSAATLPDQAAKPLSR
ncbi:hypothetical protein DP49_5423 [Burkholderia pseudomallei]|nr:hypothetical protein DP49_5423 [Burkholderia pseudomallei]